MLAELGGRLRAWQDARRSALQIARDSRKLHARVESGRLREASAPRAPQPTPEAWDEHRFRHDRRYSSPDDDRGLAPDSCKCCGHSQNSHWLPRGCNPASRDSSKPRNTRDPCIRIRNRCRRSSQYAAPNSQSGDDNAPPHSPTTEESKVRLPMGPAPTHPGPNNNHRSHSPSSRGSKCNRRPGLAAGRNWEEAAGAPMLPRAVRMNSSDRSSLRREALTVAAPAACRTEPWERDCRRQD